MVKPHSSCTDIGTEDGEEEDTVGRKRKRKKRRKQPRRLLDAEDSEDLASLLSRMEDKRHAVEVQVLRSEEGGWEDERKQWEEER